MWCLTTRVNPHTDILNPIPGGRGQTFMPAERMTAGDREWTASNTRFEGGMGIDATVPFGFESDFLRPVYPIEKVDLDDFFTGDQNRQREGPNERLGPLAGADGAIVSQPTALVPTRRPSGRLFRFSLRAAGKAGSRPVAWGGHTTFLLLPCRGLRSRPPRSRAEPLSPGRRTGSCGGASPHRRWPRAGRGRGKC